MHTQPPQQPPAGLTPQQLAQQEQRRKEEAMWAKWAQQKLSIGPWYRIDEPNPEDVNDVLSAQGGLAVDGQTKGYPPGVYRSRVNPYHGKDGKTHSDGHFDLLVTENEIKPLIPPNMLGSHKFDFKQTYRDVLDMAIAKGWREVVLDWDSPDYVTKENLEKFLKLAMGSEGPPVKPPVKVTFGKNVELFLQQNKEDPKKFYDEQQRIIEKQKEFYEKPEQVLFKELYVQEQDYTRYKDEFDKVENLTNLPAGTVLPAGITAAQWLEQALKDKVLGVPNKQGEGAVTEIEKQVKNIEDQLKAIETAKQTLHDQLKEYDQQVKDPNSNLREVGELVTKYAVERDGMVDSMETAAQNLRAEKVLWDAELTRISNALPAAPAAPAPDPHAALRAKIQAMQQNLIQIDNKLNPLLVVGGAPPAPGSINEVRDKMADLNTQLQAQRLRRP